MWETWVRSLGWEDPLEEGMATHSNILAWRIPQAEDPGSYVAMSWTQLKWLSMHTCLYIKISFPNWTIPTAMRRRQWQPTSVLLPGKSHGWRSLVGCSPWGREALDTTERLYFHFSLSCIGEGNGNPLQCSCLENPRDRGAWWAAIHGVTQSQTRLKRLSSSSSISIQLVMLSNHLILWRPLLLLLSIFPSLRSFPMRRLFTSAGQSIGTSASVSVLPILWPPDWNA